LKTVNSANVIGFGHDILHCEDEVGNKMNKGNAKYLSKSHMKKKIEFVCLVCLLI
jgi:hypothetical protein